MLGDYDSSTNQLILAQGKIYKSNRKVAENFINIS